MDDHDSPETASEIAKLKAEGSLDSSGVFTLSRELAVEKLSSHFAQDWTRVYSLIMQWMIGLGCSRVALFLGNGFCLVSGAEPQEDPFQDWPGDDLAAFLEKSRPLDRVRGYLLLELSRQSQQPGWIELYEGDQLVRSESFQTGTSAIRSLIKHSGLVVKGPKVEVSFKYASTGEDHERDLVCALQKVFPYSPVPLHLKSFGSLSSNFGDLLGANSSTDLRSVRRRSPLPLPVLFDAYDNRALGYANGQARGILMRPPFALSMNSAVVFAHWQNHALMETRPTQKVKSICSMARYFAKESWQYPEEVEEASVRGGDYIYLQTGRGRLIVHCSGGSEPDTLLPVMFGALLPEFQGRLGLPGFHVVACADGQAADLTVSKLKDDDVLADWIGEIRSSLNDLLDLVEQHPPSPGQNISAEAVPIGEAANVSVLLTMLTLPLAFKLALLIPGLFLSAGYFVVSYQWARRTGVNKALSWDADQISEFLKQSRARIRPQ